MKNSGKEEGKEGKKKKEGGKEEKRKMGVIGKDNPLLERIFGTTLIPMG